MPNRQEKCAIDLLSRSPDLVFVPSRASPITFVVSFKRKRRQPGLTPNGPELIGRRQLVGRVEGTETDFDLVPGPREDGRAAARAEMPPLIDLCLPADRYRRSRKDGRAMKQRAVVLAAIKAMAEANAMGLARDDKANIAA